MGALRPIVSSKSCVATAGGWSVAVGGEAPASVAVRRVCVARSNGGPLPRGAMRDLFLAFHAVAYFGLGGSRYAPFQPLLLAGSNQKSD